MRDELPDWAEIPAATEPDDRDRRPRGRRLLRVTAVVPWAVVAVLIGLGPLTTGRDGQPAAPSVATTAGAAAEVGTEATAADQRTTTAATAPHSDDHVAADGPPELLLTELRGQWRVSVDDGDAAALAVAVARAWLTGLEPRSPLTGLDPVADDTYVEHLVVEAVERPGPDAAVVSLLAVLLHRGDTGTEVQPVRLSVPIAFLDGQVRPAGSPWWAAPPDLRPVTLPRTPLDEPEVQLAAIDALAAAGFTITELVALEATSGWPHIATLTGTGPDGSPVAGEVWLRPHLHGFVVAGATLEPRPAPAHEEEAA